MNTLEIKNYLETNEVTRSVFLNVYAADQLPNEKISQDRWLLVCNCCPANRSGEHWVALFCENGTLEFFDSFGHSPELYDGVKEFLRVQEPKEVIFSATKLQSAGSDACGNYCILCGYLRADGDPMEVVLTNLERLNRDVFVKHIVADLLV